MSPSIWQILIVLVIVLLLFGPSRIPGLGKSLGQAIRGFKKGISTDEEIDVTDASKPDQVNQAQGAQQSQETKEKTEA